MAANEKVGIEIELMGGQEAFNLLQRIDTKIDTLNKKKKFNTLSGLNSSKAELEAYMNSLKKLNKEQEKWENLAKKVGKENMSAYGIREWDRVKKSIQETQSQIKKMGSDMDSVTQKTRTWAQTFNSASSKIAHIGSAMQSLGNGLTRLTSPFRRLTTGLLMGAGYKALNMFTEGFSGAFERADIMRNYSRSLEAFGFSATDASKAIEELNESVLGLPTGLDEIVALQKKYVAASQDIEKSTALAIATNNSFLASGSDARQRKTAERIISQLAGGAEIASSSWDALQRAMPLVFTTLAKESKMGVADYMSALKQGKISTDEFMKSFSRIGKEGAIADAANVMKQSWAGLTANIQNATKRMGTGIIESLNSVFKDSTGRTLLQRLLGVDADGKDMGDGIKHWIDDLSKSVQNWIKSHPEEIIDFFNNLKNIDWKGLLKGLAEGAKWMADIIATFAKWASDKDMSKIGKWGVKLNVFGWALSTLGGVLKGLRHPLAGIWTVISKGIGGKLGKIGLFGKIASIFGSKKSIADAGDAAKTIPTVADTFKGAFSALSGLIKAAGAITLVAGTGFVAFKAAKSILQDLKDMVDLVNGGGWDNVGYVATGVIAGIGALIEIFNYIGTALGPQGLLATAISSAASFLVAGTFTADMWAIKHGVIQIRDTITELDNVASAVTNMKGIGTLSDSVKTKFKNTIDAINEIKRMFVGKNGSKMDRGQVEAGLPSFGIGKVNALTNIANAITQMQKIVEQFNKLAVMTLQDPSQIVADIKKACDQLQGIRGPKNIEAHTTAIANALYQIRRVAYHINKLAGTDVNTSGFSSFIASLKTALSELKTLTGELELDITVKLSPNFGKSVNETISYIKKAKENIKTSTNKILRFTIPVSVKFSISSNYYSALAQISQQRQSLKDAASGGSSTYNPPSGHGATRAMGGYIYRSRGGNIGFPGRPRGTDRIPAWLTAGEYVHNERAVSTFGLDFMRKVNNLDVKGAMNELMHRAGHMANVNRGTSITNNNYNNQKVVINNNGSNGAGFTFKSASRFVGAI